MTMIDYSSQLRTLPQHHDFFIGLDSDGCVFDTPNIKQRRHFNPLIVKFWNLEKIHDVAIECAEFSNLKSRWRGSNRFAALLRTFDLLRGHPAALQSGVELPSAESLRRYVNSGLPLGEPSLEKEVERTGDAGLLRVLEWSRAVSKSIDTTMPPVPPFPNAKAALPELTAAADMAVVSQTPVAALCREWKANGLDHFPLLIAGQEHGAKANQLRLATQGKYPPERVLMVGDAMGDMEAAKQAGVLFFPILPDKENDSWRRFREEAFPRFLSGKYTHSYQTELLRDFTGLLPEVPPWKD